MEETIFFYLSYFVDYFEIFLFIQFEGLGRIIDEMTILFLFILSQFQPFSYFP